MTQTNIQLERMLESITPHLKRRDLIGYACARNYRILSTELQEYASIKNALLQELGDSAEGGVPSISPTSPNYQTFIERFEPIANVEHDVPIMPLKYTDVVGELTGEEILDIDWMLED